MCEPSTVAMLAVTAISTAVSMYGQKVAADKQESAQKAAAAYNAQIAENEAATQEQLARAETAAGIAERERQQRDAARKMSDMRANMGASGFTLDSGANLSLLADAAAEHQHDSQSIMNEAEQRARRHKTAQTSALNSRDAALYQGEQAGNDGGAAALGMAGTLLGGIASGIGQYARASGTRVPATASAAALPGAFRTPSLKFSWNP
ncbi:MAG: hypothetical protein LBR82_09500 [Desulfovibrio sp.]|nr:hypothetical protein [Desulfovibrio sp.]